MGLGADARKIVPTQNDRQDRPASVASPVPHLRRSEKNRRQFQNDLQRRRHEDRLSRATRYACSVGMVSRGSGHPWHDLAGRRDRQGGSGCGTQPDTCLAITARGLSPSRPGCQARNAAWHGRRLSRPRRSLARVAGDGCATRRPIWERNFRCGLRLRHTVTCYSGGTRTAPVGGCRMRERIALLGWGSLLWDKDDAFDDRHGRWLDDGPSLKLEFSRISEKRRGALTLVIDSEHGMDAQVAWSLSRRDRIGDAAKDLGKREKTGANRIGVYSVTGGSHAATQVYSPQSKTGLANGTWMAWSGQICPATSRTRPASASRSMPRCDT